MTRFRPGPVRAVLCAVGAGAAAYVGGLLAAGAVLAARWAGPDRAGEVAGYGLLAVLLVAAASAAWWVLLPRARWWGLPVTLLVATGHGLAFVSGW
ncbi:hypothetical protein [Actinoplanes sp. RD1]|uniref:hypothetical protein n=1 Tax=Actinoplanes sp. RD1 TaxID=3064538 RepID=UPI0027421DD2|nr:hypothetical protein [Actinoplanes sp. RD1]